MGIQVGFVGSVVGCTAHEIDFGQKYIFREVHQLYVYKKRSHRAPFHSWFEWFECSSVGNKPNFQVEFVVDGFISQTFKE